MYGICGHAFMRLFCKWYERQEYHNSRTAIFIMNMYSSAGRFFIISPSDTFFSVSYFLQGLMSDSLNEGMLFDSTTPQALHYINHEILQAFKMAWLWFSVLSCYEIHWRLHRHYQHLIDKFIIFLACQQKWKNLHQTTLMNWIYKQVINVLQLFMGELSFRKLYQY